MVVDGAVIDVNGLAGMSVETYWIESGRVSSTVASVTVWPGATVTVSV